MKRDPGKSLRFILILAAFFFLSPAGCSNSEGKSQALYETARFEEMQDNLTHAAQLYREIITDYPQTSFAEKARTRLKALKAMETAPPQEG